VPVCASGLVTAMLTVPAACAGVVAVMVVLLTKFTLVAATPPMLTVAPDAKALPVIVTDVPPAVEPEFGVMFVTLGPGADAYVNPFVTVTDCPPGFVTTMFTWPLAWLGAIALIVVLPTTFAEALVPPKVTVAPVPKPVPEIVTAVPPAVGPEFGDTASTFGAVLVAPKNSDMFGAVAAAPGKLVRPKPSAVRRSVL